MTEYGATKARYPQPNELPDGPGAFLRMAQDIERLLNTRVADLDALALADATSLEGLIRHVDEMNCNFQAVDGAWIQISPAQFASTGDRDTAFAKAGGTYRLKGAQYRINGLLWEYKSSTTGSVRLLSRPQAMVSRVVNQNIATSPASPAISMTTQNYIDPEFSHDPTGVAQAASRVIAVEACTVQLILKGLWDANTTGTRRVGYMINGGSLQTVDWTTPPGSAGLPQTAIEPFINLAAGDYIEMAVQQSVTATLGMTSASMRIERIA